MKQNFSSTYNNVLNNMYIEESVVNVNRSTLDPNVFEINDNPGPPRLLPVIKYQIIDGIKEIGGAVPVQDIFIVGSILTAKYTDNCDIDISVVVDETDISRIDFEDLLVIIKRVNGKLASGTTHPINFHIVKDSFDFNKADGVYDVPNDKWLKVPTNNDIDVQKYIQRFDSTMDEIIHSAEELRRTIIDIEEIKKLPHKTLIELRDLIEQKLEQVTSNIMTLTTIYKSVRDLRKLSFDRYMTPNEIMIIGNKNNLPENILYKLLQKYYYTEFIDTLNSIVSKKGSISTKDINKIKEAGKKLWK